MDVDKLVPEAGNLAGFIEQFPVFADAPGGVTELRELILKLAIRGLLIPCEMESFSSKELNEDFNILKLPKGWQTKIIVDVINKDKWAIKRGPFGSAIKKSFFVSSGYKVYEQQHAIYDDFSRGDYYVSSEKFDELKAFQVKPNDLIISCSGTVGKVAEAPVNMEAGIINQALLKISLDQNVLLNDYFKVLFQAYFMNTPELKNLKGTAQKNMVPVKTLKTLPFPCPPLEEQKRIVAKVDELMTLCDKLEAQQQQQAQNVLRANTAAINALLNPAPQQSENKQKTSENVSANTPETPFEQNWQRIAQHFNTLYGCTLPMPDGEGRKKKHLVGLENIKVLRQVILQLAVMGKLESRSHIDTPFKVTLKSINDLCEKKSIKRAIVRSGHLDEIEEIKFNLPQGWCLASLSQLSIFMGGGTPSKSNSSFWNGEIPWVSPKDMKSENITDSELKITNEGLKKSTVKLIPKGSLLLVARSGILKRTLPVSISCIDCTLNQDMKAIVPLLPEMKSYLKVLLNGFTPFILKELVKGGMTVQSLRYKEFESYNFPFPPLEEQKRIVAKVDQLMTLCDQLEQQLTKSYSDAEKLMQATVKALTV